MIQFHFSGIIHEKLQTTLEVTKVNKVREKIRRVHSAPLQRLEFDAYQFREIKGFRAKRNVVIKLFRYLIKAYVYFFAANVGTTIIRQVHLIWYVIDIADRKLACVTENKRKYNNKLFHEKSHTTKLYVFKSRYLYYNL